MFNNLTNVYEGLTHTHTPHSVPCGRFVHHQFRRKGWSIPYYGSLSDRNRLQNKNTYYWIRLSWYLKSQTNWLQCYFWMQCNCPSIYQYYNSKTPKRLRSRISADNKYSEKYYVDKHCFCPRRREFIIRIRRGGSGERTDIFKIHCLISNESKSY